MTFHLNMVSYNEESLENVRIFAKAFYNVLHLIGNLWEQCNGPNKKVTCLELRPFPQNLLIIYRANRAAIHDIQRAPEDLFHNQVLTTPQYN